MSAAFEQPAATVPLPRDRWGRPGILQPNGKLEYYPRVSTLCKTLEDGWNLAQWGERMVAEGLAIRSDLMAKVMSQVGRPDTPERKKILQEACAEAKEAAGSTSGRNMGTALHEMARTFDEGIVPAVPAEMKADLVAYAQLRAAKKLKVAASEVFVIIEHEGVKAAGTFDRAYLLPDGRGLVSDLKTGQWEDKFPNATCLQLALYSYGRLYDPATGKRSDLPFTLSHEEGLMIHIPAGQGTAKAIVLDLVKGWEAVKHAVWTYGHRKDKSLVKGEL